MSRSVDIVYELQRERRHQMYLSQVATTTRSFLNRYQSLLDDMDEQNISQYVQTEYSEARDLLGTAFYNIDSNPEYSRDLSRQIGAIVGGLPRLARSLRDNAQIQARIEERQREKAERIAHAQSQKKLMEQQKAFLMQIDAIIDDKIKDPVALDFVYDQIKELRDKYSQKVAAGENINALQSDLSAELDGIANLGRQKAHEWRERKKNSESRSMIEDQINITRGVIDAQKTVATDEELQAISKKLTQLQTDFDSGLVTIENALSQINEATKEADEVVLGEDIRRETLKALRKTLKELGFLFPTNPTIEGDFVKLQAKRTNGQECTFLVKLDGGMHYSFDNYRGSACKKDLENILPKLEEVYGIKLSNERVIWENPDEIGKEAKDLPDGNKIGGSF